MKDSWFSRITGFDESGGYADVQSRLEVDGDFLVSTASPRRTRCGRLELVSLATLRERVGSGECIDSGHVGDDDGDDGGPGSSGVNGVDGVKGVNGAKSREGEQPNIVTNLRGEARALHRDPEHAGAVIQVASQFNLLEMVGPDVTPEQGVARYEHDRTQGPACAMAAGAATIYRNYLVPVGSARGTLGNGSTTPGSPSSGSRVDGSEIGQTAKRQLDGLADLGAALSEVVGLPVNALWTMRNGYALCTGKGLDAIRDYLTRASEAERDDLRSRLRIGVHRDIEVTDVVGAAAPLVTHALCSALPIAYGSDPGHRGWEPFARLVLEATYESTLLAGVLNRQRGVSPIVLLTCVGGGVFGNRDEWIDAAIRRALLACAGRGLDVRIVSYAAVPGWLKRLAADSTRAA